MNCSECGDNSPIVNKHFKLCLKCNTSRLRDLKNINDKVSSKDVLIDLNKLKTNERVDDKYSFVKNFVSKKTTSNKIKEDEDFYEKCFNNSDHKCEECGTQLPDIFRNDENKVVARWRYSHIIPKSIAPNLRHNILNINHLCLKHHMEWENGDKQSMNIYKKNKAILPNYF